MRACASCFASTTWVSNASPPTASPAVCDFCGNYAHHTWPTTAWAESFTRLFAMYDIEEEPGRGTPLHVHIQDDWRIFSFNDLEQVKVFLSSAVSHPLLEDGILVKLRFSATGPNADHIVSWSRFSDEIRTRNRYFPEAELDGDLLRQAILGSVESIDEGRPLYRARVLVGAESPGAGDMGAPPAGKASPGRANPVGIPYLYLSYEERTCIHETRVANHTQVAIGTFRTKRDLKVLNLADIEAPDFFSVEDPIASISFHRYLQALANELKKPVRASDQPIDYIPTQYLCEMAKSLGLDGVLYSSSLDPDGRNVVLFDVNAAECQASVKLVEITSLVATWQVVA